MTLEALHKLLLRHPEVSTDSRKIPENGIFFALKGPTFNGNAFAREALGKGAALAVVDEPGLGGEGIIEVDDVLQTLQQLATYHREYCKTPVIALTGSNGKTTTKELIAAVLRKRYRTQATEGNLNNHIGVPLTLLKLRPDTEMAVVEMGANHLGEIAFLCGLARPDYGYITNFGKAHLEGFGGVEGVIRGKSELYDYLKAHGKTVFMNADDALQRQRLAGYAHTVGFSASADPPYYPIANLGANPFVELEVEGTPIKTQLMGSYNFPNCAAAALIGHYFGVPVGGVAEALAGYTPSNNRSQLLERGSLRIILDAYNANPSSMGAALGHFGQLDAPRKIAILGDMFELGAEAEAEHLAIGELAKSLGLDGLYLVGKHFHATGLPEARFPNFEDLKARLAEHPLQGPATVLIKGSRGMALERVLECL